MTESVYRIDRFDRSTSPLATSSLWTVRFIRLGDTPDPATLEVTVPSAVFAGLDLDGDYALADIERLKTVRKTL